MVQRVRCGMDAVASVATVDTPRYVIGITMDKRRAMPAALGWLMRRARADAPELGPRLSLRAV
ncbi:hypothetical protein [Mycobacterium camsae]|uniref:hypothetical protein n=1 Tax=Mycobacterium gordonae TaxID=1778 RepID=UPI00197F18E7|nr:hypothetical protein [Mycobacterium gordonae]